MKTNIPRKRILITGISLMILILVLTFLIIPNFGFSKDQSKETFTIPSFGTAMVTIDDSNQKITGSISVDSFGQITIKDDLTGNAYKILASQIINTSQLVSLEVQGPDGQSVELIGEVVAQSENGTSTVLDPATGNQYVVETQILKKVSANKITSTQPTTESSDSTPTTDTIATTTTQTAKSAEPVQTSATKAAATSITTQPTAAPTTQVTSMAPVVADDITHESYTVSTDPTLETACIGSPTSTASDQPVNEAIVMDSSYIQVVLAEINRVRVASNDNPLMLDSAGSDYSQTVLKYAKDLALGIANNAPTFPHVWTVTQSENGAAAAQQLVEMTSAVLDPSVQTVAICATKSSVTGDIYLVVAF